MAMFQYLICDMNFGTIKAESISWISVNRLVFNAAKRYARLFTNKMKDLVRIELSFFQEAAIIVRVNMELHQYLFF